MLGEPGSFSLIEKSKLFIPFEYQRNSSRKGKGEAQVRNLQRNWSWFSCGVLLVARRGTKLWVVDGQNRLMAASQRPDIETLPCIVFHSNDIKAEAKAFIDINAGRVSVKAIERFKALNIAEDSTAKFVNKTLALHGLHLSKTANHAMDIKCIALCQALAEIDRENFSVVIAICAQLSKAGDRPVPEKLINGLFFCRAI